MWDWEVREEGMILEAKYEGLIPQLVKVIKAIDI